MKNVEANAGLQTMVDIIRNKPMDLKRAADYFGVCVKTIREWSKEGLETVQYGKKIYTTLENLQRFGVQRIPANQPRLTSLERSHQEATRILAEEHGIT